MYILAVPWDKLEMHSRSQIAVDRSSFFGLRGTIREFFGSLLRMPRDPQSSKQVAVHCGTTDYDREGEDGTLERETFIAQGNLPIT